MSLSLFDLEVEMAYRSHERTHKAAQQRLIRDAQVRPPATEVSRPSMSCQQDCCPATAAA